MFSEEKFITKEIFVYYNKKDFVFIFLKFKFKSNYLII